MTRFAEFSMFSDFWTPACNVSIGLVECACVRVCAARMCVCVRSHLAHAMLAQGIVRPILARQ